MIIMSFFAIQLHLAANALILWYSANMVISDLISMNLNITICTDVPVYDIVVLGMNVSNVFD